jgi:hypothetical protein
MLLPPSAYTFPADLVQRGGPFAGRFFGDDLLEHIHRIGQLRGQVEPQNIEDFNQRRISKGVKDLVPNLAVCHDPLGPQNRKMLRGIGLLELQLFDQPAGRRLAIPKGFDNRDTGRVRQALKDFSLEATERIVIQWNQYIRIDEYMQIPRGFTLNVPAIRLKARP